MKINLNPLHRPKPIFGQIRIKSRFAILPRITEDRWFCWLCKVYIVQQYYRFTWKSLWAFRWPNLANDAADRVRKGSLTNTT